jgi:hypothetical protein
MIIAYNDQLQNYTLSADSFSDLYPVENIQDRRLDKYWKGTDSDAVQDIIIDCGSVKTPGIFILLGHNFSSFVAPEIKILGNATNDFSSPTYSYTFTDIADIMFHVYTGVAYQYFCIRISGCTATDIPILGRLFIDDDSFLTGFKLSKIHPIEYSDKSNYEKSHSGILFGYNNPVVLRSFKLVYDYMTGANFILYRAFYMYVKKAEPFIIIWDENQENVGLENIYCNITSNLQNHELFGFSAFAVSHEIEETK